MPIEVSAKDRLHLFLWDNYREICAEYVVYRATQIIHNGMKLATATKVACEFSALRPIQTTIEMLMDIAAEKELLSADPKDI